MTRESLANVCFRKRLVIETRCKTVNWNQSGNLRSFERAVSALRLCMCSIKFFLFLNTLPLTCMYREWYLCGGANCCYVLWCNVLSNTENTLKERYIYRCLSIFLASRYFLRRRRRTRRRRIQRILTGIRALAVPRRLPRPMWRPFRRASALRQHLKREWMAIGLRMMRPSLTNFRTACPLN